MLDSLIPTYFNLDYFAGVAILHYVYRLECPLKRLGSTSTGTPLGLLGKEETQNNSEFFVFRPLSV